MDIIKRWFDSTETAQSGYAPLPRHQGGSHSGDLSASSDGYEHPNSYHKKLSSSGHRNDDFANDLPSVEDFGIELHPETSALLEDEEALTKAFGGSGTYHTAIRSYLGPELMTLIFW